MRELLPGIYHWTARHPKIKQEVSSYYFEPERVLIDPILPEEGVSWFVGHVERPAHVLLTNRHHYRDSDAFVDAFGCEVHVHRAGLHEFKGKRRKRVVAFDPGDTLPGGVEALGIDVLCPDESALLVHREGGIVCLADAVIRDGEGPMAFVPDALLGDDPQAIKDGLQQRFRDLVVARSFQHVLLAHGAPWIDGGSIALNRFAGGL